MSHGLIAKMELAAIAVAAALAVVVSEAAADDAAVPLLARYCHRCHAGDVLEGDVDLSSAGQVPAMRAAIRHWQRAAEVVADGQMPPQDAEQPSDAEREEIAAWLAGFLRAEAEAHAGDPGRVVLRRLNNAEYTYTIRELTGVDTLSPAHEFPAEGGAGEGFTNTGQSLVMSPSMVVKYLDAGKDIARHLVLLPEGIRFSAGQSRRDFTDELLEKVRALYRRSTQPLAEAAVGSQTTVEQGITLDMGREGFLPLRASLEAARDLAGDAADREPIESVAADRGLSPRYLRLLLESLESEPAGSLLLDRLRGLWTQQPGVPLELLVNEIEGWQQVLWRFNKVGQIGRHLGREDGPASWMEAVSPLVARQEYRVPMPAADADGMVTLHLAATAAGDGSTNDLVVFERPRLVAAGRGDLPLLAVGDLADAVGSWRATLTEQTSGCLAAAAEGLEQMRSGTGAVASVDELAAAHAVDPRILQGWRPPYDATVVERCRAAGMPVLGGEPGRADHRPRRRHRWLAVCHRLDRGRCALGARQRLGSGGADSWHDAAALGGCASGSQPAGACVVGQPDSPRRAVGGDCAAGPHRLRQWGGLEPAGASPGNATGDR